MRVLLLAPHAFYVDRGTPIDVDLMLRVLSERGDVVDAVVYHEGEDRTYPNVTLHRIRAPRWLKNVGPGFSFKKLLCDVQVHRVACRLMRHHRYDMVHAGEEAAFSALWFKWTRGVPYIYDMDSSIAQQMIEKMPWLHPISWVFNAAERFVARRCIAAAPVCHALVDLARRHGAPHVVAIHDISQLKDPDRPATGWLKQQLDTTRPLLMYVGNLEAYQGVDLLLAAFRLAVRDGADVDLVIAGGSDEDIARYRQRIAAMQLSGRAHLLGRWPAAKLDELLAEADILTAPRIKGINTPMKVFPYMHSGRPVLVTDLPTHSQVLTPQVAALAPAEPHGFAQAIIRLSRDEAYRRELGRAGRAFIEANHVYASHRRRVNELYDYVESACRPNRTPATPHGAAAKEAT
jgi:glycosyltransferase involved in cell wall biosynthesis